MDPRKKETLNRELIEAFYNGNRKRLVDIYSQQGFHELKIGKSSSGFFFITQAYIYALEEGLNVASHLYETLQQAGREK